MKLARIALVAALLVVTSSIAVGAAASTQTTEAAEAPTPLGMQLSSVMQANAGQAAGAIENGMWEAAFASATDRSTKLALIDRHATALNGSMDELAAERHTLREALRNGSITRQEYRARMAALVGRLASVGEGIEESSERARAVGVDTDRLDELRSKARNLGGGEISELARNLTGNGMPPGRSAVFGDDRPERSGSTGPPGTPGQGPPDDHRRGPSTETPTASDEDS